MTHQLLRLPFLTQRIASDAALSLFLWSVKQLLEIDAYREYWRSCKLFDLGIFSGDSIEQQWISSVLVDCVLRMTIIETKSQNCSFLSFFFSVFLLSPTLPCFVILRAPAMREGRAWVCELQQQTHQKNEVYWQCDIFSICQRDWCKNN